VGVKNDWVRECWGIYTAKGFAQKYFQAKPGRKCTTFRTRPKFEIKNRFKLPLFSITAVRTARRSGLLACDTVFFCEWFLKFEGNVMLSHLMVKQCKKNSPCGRNCGDTE